MRSLQLALVGAFDVLIAGLLFGAGLPVVYALAMRALTFRSTTLVDDHGAIHTRPSPLGRGLSVLLIAVVVVGVGLGLVLIVASGFGKAVSFENIVPMIVDKKK
ncbi:hypothetical protein [Oryzobacter telluris]|jgi:hypothetical protein|uniref:hypothetical protein n=1 Tax=Oryzobacter telluris TaxID=3149179 RepID=UPI00370DCEFF